VSLHKFNPAAAAALLGWSRPGRSLPEFDGRAGHLVRASARSPQQGDRAIECSLWHLTEQPRCPTSVRNALKADAHPTPTADQIQSDTTQRSAEQQRA